MIEGLVARMNAVRMTCLDLARALSRPGRPVSVDRVRTWRSRPDSRPCCVFMEAAVQDVLARAEKDRSE